MEYGKTNLKTTYIWDTYFVAKKNKHDSALDISTVGSRENPSIADIARYMCMQNSILVKGIVVLSTNILAQSVRKHKKMRNMKLSK